MKKVEVLLLLATLAACSGPDKPAVRATIDPPSPCPTGSIYSVAESVCVCPPGQIDTTHMKRNKFGVWQKAKMVCGQKPFTRTDSTYLEAMTKLQHGNPAKTNR